jgi:hypothetical protein
VAADAWKRYDKFPLRLGDGGLDMDADTFKVALHLSASNAATLSTEGWGAVTSEHAAANGYTAGGATLASVTWTEASGTITFDSADPAWTASGGSIVARFAVIYDDTVTTPTADVNVCFSLLDNTPADVTVTDTNTLTLVLNASGILTLSGGQ